MKPQTKDKEVRQEGVLRFEITTSVDNETPLSWLEMGTMSDHHGADDIYVDRGKKWLYGLAVAYVKTDNIRVYWDKYTGGTPTDDYPFWVAPKEAKDWTIEQILETYERAESYGSEWQMIDYTCELYCDDLLIGSSVGSIDSDCPPAEHEMLIDSMMHWCKNDIPYFIQTRQAVLDKLAEVVKDA